MFSSLNINTFLVVAMSLFVIGFLGIIINKRDIITMLLSLEVMLLAINLNFLIYAFFKYGFIGHIFPIYILTVAAAEAAISLAILIRLFRSKGSIEVKETGTLFG